MARSQTDDPLDDVLAEIERARTEPTWVPEERTPKRLLRAPEPLAEARWTPSRTAVGLVIACALLAGAVLGVRVLLARSGTDSTAGSASPTVAGRATTLSTAAPSTAVTARSADPTPSGATAPGVTDGGAATSWRIHVVGAVRRPGVVSVPAGSRVADAVRAAGGLHGSADAAGVNLARTLQDGEQVHVPKPGERWTPPPDSQPGGPNPAGAAAASSGDLRSTPAGNGKVGGPSDLVNLNTADLAALDSLPGVGPVTAQRILDWRSEHGRFSSIDELAEVSGIGDRTLERLRPKVTV